MRFLCLHGRGTNAKIFEMQTVVDAQPAKIREALDDHDFVFVDGTINTVPAEGAAAVTDEFYGYLEEHVDVNNASDLVLNMIQFIEINGPFDAVMGFSEGGIIAAMLLIEDCRRPFAGFKCGIFFSAAPPLDPDVVSTGVLRCVHPDRDGVLIQVPTAHIEDPALLHDALVRLCDDRLRQAFLHNQGHDIPGANSPRELSGVIRAIERTIETARAQSA